MKNLRQVSSFNKIIIILLMSVLLARTAKAQVQGWKLQFRILEVKALDETNPEWPGSDDIFLGGVFASRYGGVYKVPYRDLGDFDDGTTKRFYNTPWVFAEIPLTQFPESVVVTLSLVEEDSGGKDAFLSSLYEEHRKEQVGAALAGLNAGEIAYKVAEEVLKEAAKQIYNKVRDSMQDDLFEPWTDWVSIQSANTVASSWVEQVTLEGHGGKYRIVYEWKFVPTSAPSFNIRSTASGACLDVPAELLHQNGTKLQQWICHGPNQTNQQWYLNPVGEHYQIISKATGQCLDVPLENLNQNGARMQMWNCYGAGQTNQLWRLRQVGNSYQIVSAANGKCLDLALERWKQNGGWVQQWQCHGANQTNQLWRVTAP